MQVAASAAAACWAHLQQRCKLGAERGGAQLQQGRVLAEQLLQVQRTPMQRSRCCLLVMQHLQRLLLLLALLQRAPAASNSCLLMGAHDAADARQQPGRARHLLLLLLLPALLLLPRLGAGVTPQAARL